MAKQKRVQKIVIGIGIIDRLRRGYGKKCIDKQQNVYKSKIEKKKSQMKNFFLLNYCTALLGGHQ